jgi:cell wall-associated NlpC family hydrolase
MDVARSIRRGLVPAVLGLLLLPVASPGDLARDLSARRATVTSLQAQIAAETRRINATGESVRQAQARLAAAQAELERRQAELNAVRADIVSARQRLEVLENRLHRASTALEANLIADYKNPAPDVVTVVLESHGFADALERLNFMRRVQQKNARILGDTKDARVKVLAQTERLQTLLVKNRELADAVLNSRNAAAAIQSALLARQAAQLQKRATTSAQLGRVRGQISSIKSRIARIARQQAAATAPNSSPGSSSSPQLPIDPGGMAQAPPGAPAAVRQVIAAGNAIAGLPYVWGGGHGAFRASGYDCSGSVSYALAAAGLLSSPLDSTGFESWGEAGPGKWITVYANAGHAFMIVAGWRFDTSALSGGGTRWTRAMRSTGGFVARHPAGL